MSKARIYIVNDPRDAEIPFRLVRAISQGQAVKHVTRPYVARIATTDDVAELFARGVRVESAGADEGAQS